MIIRFMQEQSILEAVLHQRKFPPRFSAENIGEMKLCSNKLEELALNCHLPKEVGDNLAEKAYRII